MHADLQRLFGDAGSPRDLLHVIGGNRPAHADQHRVHIFDIPAVGFGGFLQKARTDFNFQLKMFRVGQVGRVMPADETQVAQAHQITAIQRLAQPMLDQRRQGRVIVTHAPSAVRAADSQNRIRDSLESERNPTADGDILLLNIRLVEKRDGGL